MKKSLKKENLKFILAGALTGAVNGFFGGGGGIVSVAILKKCGLEAKKAHAAAVACVLPLCVVSGAVYFLRGQIELREVLPYIPGGLVGAFLGTKLLKKLKSCWTELIFAVLLIFMGVRMLNA